VAQEEGWKERLIDASVVYNSQFDIDHQLELNSDYPRPM